MSAYDKQVQDQRKAQEQEQGQGQRQGMMNQLVKSLVRGARLFDPKATVLQDSIKAAPADAISELNKWGIKPLAAMLMTYDAADAAKVIKISKRDSAAQDGAASQQESANKNQNPKRHGGKADDVDVEDLSKRNIVPGCYREIYIHSKLMFVDDVYTTLGSANLNARSMVGDSELNICTEELSFTQAARKRVWGNLAGADLDGKECTRDQMKETYQDWQQRMTNNKKNRKEGKAPVNNSFIHPFEDPRDSPVMRLV